MVATTFCSVWTDLDSEDDPPRWCEVCKLPTPPLPLHKKKKKTPPPPPPTIWRIYSSNDNFHVLVKGLQPVICRGTVHESWRFWYLSIIALINFSENVKVRDLRHQYRRGHGFEPRTTLFFFRLYFRNCFAYCDELLRIFIFTPKFKYMIIHIYSLL